MVSRSGQQHVDGAQLQAAPFLWSQRDYSSGLYEDHTGVSDMLGNPCGDHMNGPQESKSVVLEWHEILLACIRGVHKLAPTICARHAFITQAGYLALSSTAATCAAAFVAEHPGSTCVLHRPKSLIPRFPCFASWLGSSSSKCCQNWRLGCIHEGLPSQSICFLQCPCRWPYTMHGRPTTAMCVLSTSKETK